MEKINRKKSISRNQSALIGIGYWGKVHFKYLKNIKNINLKKIFYKKKLKNVKNLNIKKTKFTNSIKDILTDVSIKHVDIVTPVETHAPLAIKFLKKNKNVLVEKPLLMKKNEEYLIEKLAKKNRKKITISYPYLFSKSLLLGKKIIKSKKLGKLNFIEITIQQCGRFMKYDINSLLAPHAISIFSIFHKIDNFKLKSFKFIKNKSKNETVGLQCFHKNNILGIANLSLNYASKKNIKKITLFCEKGTIICDLDGKQETISSFKYLRLNKGRYKIAKIKKYINRKFDEKNNMKYVIEDFYFKKNNLLNFKLTKKINQFIKNV